MPGPCNIYKKEMSIKSERIISLNAKSLESLTRKKHWHLLMNLIISILGVSALYIKFFKIDGLLAFRAFTVNGNLFTTIVSIASVVLSFKIFKMDEEIENRTMFFLSLCSAVTEAVIFIIVMMGYLPFFEDNPAIWPYDMFCLHVAIPLVAVAKFVFFERPQGILEPYKLLIGTIPIGVYAIFIVSAIKIGILPIELVPYSFLEFDSHFLWYVVFAAIVIPSFGYLWSWMFYRLNIRTSLHWYDPEDIEKLKKSRIKSLTSFDVVNSSLLLIYCALAVIVLMFSMMATSETSTKIQHEMLPYTCYYMLDDYSNSLGADTLWEIKDGVLYKGDIRVGDGTEQGACVSILTDDEITYEATIFIKASDLSPEISSKYNPDDYVSVKHSSGKKGPVTSCGEILDPEIVSIANGEKQYYVGEEEIDGERYVHYAELFGPTLQETGVGIMSLYVPASELTMQAKTAEYGHDLMMLAIIVTVFTVLYLISLWWIKTLEKSVLYLKAIAGGMTPEEEISLGRAKRLEWLERELNVLREINKD